MPIVRKTHSVLAMRASRESSGGKSSGVEVGRRRRVWYCVRLSSAGCASDITWTYFQDISRLSYGNFGQGVKLYGIS